MGAGLMWGRQGGEETLPARCSGSLVTSMAQAGKTPLAPVRML